MHFRPQFKLLVFHFLQSLFGIVPDSSTSSYLPPTALSRATWFLSFVFCFTNHGDRCGIPVLWWVYIHIYSSVRIHYRQFLPLLVSRVPPKRKEEKTNKVPPLSFSAGKSLSCF
ncbi:hypothetical protein GGU10DRAFT_71228 [Lentinula aff. detonsa]|uniref:Secreted protein n=1 Tax=Lentinula aff. detonsa TaxID=2804958 RepID=A0AA38NQC0_9AGAR|nr:hypothetical protein GGU10DRAFT_71228 [Lentinula aff. detonsa]